MYFILIPVLFLFAAMILQGITHAILYTGKTENAFRWNEHIVFNFERINWGLIGLACMVLAGANFYLLGIKEGITQCLVDSVFLTAISFLSLSFWHNGAYGVTLLRINTKEAGFWLTVKMWGYYSQHDTAKNKYDFTSRLCMFATACILIAIRIITF